jgi:hypothetical protein
MPTSTSVSPLAFALALAWLGVACARSGTTDPSSGGTFVGAAGGGDDSGGFVTTDPRANGSDAGRPPKCDDAGNCSCINIASIGRPAHYGVAGLNSDNTNAFTDWLNANSSASVDMYMTHPTITADFLAKYDVLLIQWLTDSNTGPYWTFSDDEINTLKKWVNDGGGLITLSGYDMNAEEVTPLNRLLSFTDISYDKDNVLPGCAMDGGTSLCYCWGNPVPLGGWMPGPIGQNVTQVGAFYGRSIRPGNATVDCSDPATSKVYAAHEVVGKGHVFAYTDEWVTYSSQWLGTSSVNASAMYTDPNNPCYMKSAADVFQVPQLWYNVIKWEASGTQCIFKIRDPGIIQ